MENFWIFDSDVLFKAVLFTSSPWNFEADYWEEECKVFTFTSYSAAKQFILNNLFIDNNYVYGTIELVLINSDDEDDYSVKVIWEAGTEEYQEVPTVDKNSYLN